MSRRRFVSHTLGWSLAAAFAVLLLGAIGVGAVTYDHAYARRIFPGVRIGPVAVGGLTPREATERVQARVDAYLATGIPFTLDGTTVTVNAIVRGPNDSDLTYAVVDVDVPALVDAAFAVGRRDVAAASWTERIQGAVGDDRVVAIHATVDADRLHRALARAFSGTLQPMTPPRLRIARAADGTTTWTVTDGTPGRTIDRAALAAALDVRFTALDRAAVAVPTAATAPSYDRAAVAAHLPEFDRALARAPIALVDSDHRWTIDAATLAGWMTVDDAARPALDRDALAAFVQPIATAVEHAPEDARFTIDPATHRVREFRAARDGVRINRDALAARLADAVFGTAPPVVPIPTATAAPTVALAATNDLGIRELLGRGVSSFAGSPKNRKHNIGIGTDLLNGLLIAPDEEFSLVHAISPFDDTMGYKPELVIKEGKTTPEFGGGLCQVATTLFRSVLNAGVPVLERTNHAYRVPYYEPPVGRDATIYGPKPDFKFKNDTGHSMLLLARVEGLKLVYELWGTSDGRTVTMTEPEVFNFVEPPPMKIVETDDPQFHLKPGEKKCTEKAHTGADAKFTYTVTRADGTKAERVFRSHYRPWQAVCLVGKAPAPPVAPSPPEIPATSGVGPIMPAPPPATPLPDANFPIGGAN